MGDETITAQQDQKQYLSEQLDMKTKIDYDAFSFGWLVDTDPICFSEEKQSSKKLIVELCFTILRKCGLQKR